MKIHRLWVDQKGESHFQDVEVEYVESTRPAALSRAAPRHRHHLPRGPARLRSRLASRAPPAVHHQPRRRRADHGQRRGGTEDRRRRGPAGRGLLGQGAPVQGARRQASQLHLRPHRVMGRLDGKVVVVTGASRGLGAEIASLLAAEGGARRVRRPHPPRGRSPLAGSLEPRSRASGPGREGPPLHRQHRRDGRVRAAARHARKVYGPVDVMVNNAALTTSCRSRTTAVGKWIASWNVNVHAPFVLSQLALADMIRASAAPSSTLARARPSAPAAAPTTDPAAGARGGTCYGAQKAALERFTRDCGRGVRATACR